MIPLDKAMRSAIVLALAGSVAFAGSISANELAYGRMVTMSVVGFRGNQGIRTDPPTIQIMGFAHPAQIGFDNNGNFIGLGTYKSRGTNIPNAVHNCPNHYDPTDWTGYYDFQVLGTYGCYDFCVSCWTTGANPSFVIEWTYCDFNAKWVLYFAGVKRGCVSGPSSGINPTAGLETFGHEQDQNIDVKWTNMTFRAQGSSTWAPCLGNTQPGFADPSYSYSYVSNCAWNTYLAPLN